jgi:TonB-linked SusC/RagA family outer membrane protein
MNDLSLCRARKLAYAIGLAIAASAAAADVVQAQTGTVSGRVTDAASGRPIATGRVSVVGTQIAAPTNSEGRFVLRGVPSGTVTVRATSIGYGEQQQRVNVAASQASAISFELRAVAVSLAGVVVTATGEQSRIEMGNSIANVNAREIVEKSAVSNMADLMTARAPGVMVIPGTQTGAGVRVRIRGTSSLSLSNNPIYYVDGVRVEGTTGSSSISVGGTTPSRINDLNPEEIESLEIVRGPSASSLYGTDAANGVIVITTKRGIAGKPRWNYYTEQTAITDRNDYPTAYRAWRTGTTSGTTSTRSNTVQCFLTQSVAGTCKQDSVTSYNLHKDEEATPFGTGYRQQHGLQLSGGSDAIRYFLHGEWADETGRIKLPEFDKRYLAARGIRLKPEQEDPNHLGKVSARANLNIALANNADLAINTAYTTDELRLPRSDDSGTPGIAANTYGGPGFKYNLNAAGDTLYGWREFLPRQIFQAVTQQDINRMISSVNASWRPRGWLDLRSNFGLDYIGRKDTQYCAFEECTSTSDRMGFKIDNRSSFFIYTFDAGGTATRQISTGIESRTAVGVQYYQNLFNRNGAQGTQLTPGSITVQAGAVRTASEVNEESRTLGAYVEQRLTFNDRLFLTGAVRSDRNSAFGANFKTVFYPKFSASWLVSDEPFLGKPGWMNQLRLRAAYGASGVQPGTTDAVPFYQPTRTIGESGEAPGLLFQTLGNAQLKPERSTEFEAGFDASFFDDRMSLEVTHYRKNSKDALISRPLPPSLGTGSTARFENLGHVRNWGFEGLFRAEPVRGSRFGWDVTLNGSVNNNRIVKLGVPTIITSSTIRQVEGSPLNGWWARRLMDYDDADGNGIITLSEITVSDTAEYHGYAVPRYEATLSNGFELSRRIRILAMLDYKGGHLIYNNSERIRCASRFNCEGLLSSTASLRDQARTVMVREHSSASAAGFFEPGDFLRLRELNVSYTMPENLSGRLRARSAVVTLAARNVGMLWTRYSGVDPEAFGTTGDSPSSFQAFAPPTYYSFRLTLGF